MLAANVQPVTMKKELGLLNLFCLIAALLFLGFTVWNLVTSSDFLSTDNLFVTMVCLVMALMFAVNPLLYLKSEGRLPVPFTKKAAPEPPRIASSGAPALLDAKGRPVPADVRQIVARMGQQAEKDAQ